MKTRPKLFKKDNTWYCKLHTTVGKGTTPRQAFANFKHQYYPTDSFHFDDTILNILHK